MVKWRKQKRKKKQNEFVIKMRQIFKSNYKIQIEINPSKVMKNCWLYIYVYVYNVVVGEWYTIYIYDMHTYIYWYIVLLMDDDQWLMLMMMINEKCKALTLP